MNELTSIFYGCETWSLKLQEEHICRYRVFQNKVLRYQGTNRRLDKVRDEKSHNLNSSSDIIRMVKSRRMRCVGHVARIDKMRKI
jgi:hypothetical protein